MANEAKHAKSLVALRQKLGERQEAPTLDAVLAAANPVERCDDMLSRFLQHNDYKLAATIKHLIANTLWRQENNMNAVALMSEEEVLGDSITPKQMFEWYLAYQYGHDKLGRPCMWVDAGGGGKNSAVILEKCGLQAFLRYHGWKFEQLNLMNHLKGEKPGFTYIFDLKRASITMMSLAWMRLTPAYVKMEAANYPKCIAAIFIVCPPFGFSTAWGFIKPLLSKDQREMIKVFPTEKALSDFIESDQLPGTATQRKKGYLVQESFTGNFFQRQQTDDDYCNGNEEKDNLGEDISNVSTARTNSKSNINSNSNSDSNNTNSTNNYKSKSMPSTDNVVWRTYCSRRSESCDKSAMQRKTLTFMVESNKFLLLGTVLAVAVVREDAVMVCVVCAVCMGYVLWAAAAQAVSQSMLICPL